ncbi:hypothetical protein ABT095_29070 [Kitasatospora sp. NPDC002227]|uniref:hypothetical protein n=1 Tax=Kitasatospora sp. NPDC002227 TaxID=3154773 RepID=UPI00331EAE3D
MTESQVSVEKDGRWWIPGLLSTVLWPVWVFGFLILNVIATLVKFGDTGCDDGSGACMGAGHEVKTTVAAMLGAAALAAVTTWLLPRRRRLRVARWSLAAASVLLGLAVLAIGASTPSH